MKKTILVCALIICALLSCTAASASSWAYITLNRCDICGWSGTTYIARTCSGQQMSYTSPYVCKAYPETCRYSDKRYYNFTQCDHNADGSWDCGGRRNGHSHYQDHTVCYDKGCFYD